METKESNNGTDFSTYILHDDLDEQYYIQYDPTIKTFQHHSNNQSKVICETCGLSGYPACKCYRRGFNLLPHNIQRRVSTYNTK